MLAACGANPGSAECQQHLDEAKSYVTWADDTVGGSQFDVGLGLFYHPALEGRVGGSLDEVIIDASGSSVWTSGGQVLLDIADGIEGELVLWGDDRLRIEAELLTELAVLNDENDPVNFDNCPPEGACFSTRREEIQADLRSLGIVNIVAPSTWEGVVLELAGVGAGKLVSIGGKTFTKIGDDFVEIADGVATNKTPIETSNGALVRPPDSPNYSVATEVQLPSNAYPGVSRQRHNQISNQAMHEAFEADPVFAAQMENLYPGIVDGVNPGPRGAFPRSAPTSDVTWHHGTQPGQMQLIPIDQHTAPGPVQGTLHPSGSGGFADWGTE